MKFYPDEHRFVWIVNSAGHDYSEAEKFGELRAITNDKVNVFNGQRVAQEMHQTMEDYQKKDWLLLSGHAVLNSLATSIVLEKHGEVNFLIYDVVKHRYVPRDINIKQIRNEVRIPI
jgi:hypothetical protein